MPEKQMSAWSDRSQGTYIDVCLQVKLVYEPDPTYWQEKLKYKNWQTYVHTETMK